MPSLFCEIPCKEEVFSVVSRPLTDKELEQVAYEVECEARIFLEDPRKWPNLDMFTGFQIGNAALTYQLTSDQIGTLSQLVKKRLDADKD